MTTMTSKNHRVSRLPRPSSEDKVSKCGRIAQGIQNHSKRTNYCISRMGVLKRERKVNQRGVSVRARDRRHNTHIGRDSSTTMDIRTVEMGNMGGCMTDPASPPRLTRSADALKTSNGVGPETRKIAFFDVARGWRQQG